ncbi:MAG: serine/threonine-protein kinase [Planctomycetota bacterium]
MQTQIPPAPKRILDRYQRLALIGSGGGSEVYRAFDPIMDQTVALKRMQLERTDRAEDQARFLREPLAMQSIDHPCVPKQFDLVEDAFPKPYFTMELIRGVDLRRILYGLRGGVSSVIADYPLERLAAIVAEVGDCLAAAHEAGVLHRDVKPENIMVMESGDVKLIDWGTAKWIIEPDRQADESSPVDGVDRRVNVRLTHVDQIIGTPLYMSPEQIGGTFTLDGRSDVFSLGAVLFDCLALNTLVQGNDLASVLNYTLGGDYRTPTDVGRRDWVPEELEAICMRAVSRDRERRFQSAREMAEALSEAMCQAV